MKKRLTSVLFVLGILLVLVSALLAGWSALSENRAEKERETILTQLRLLIPEPHNGGPDGRSDPTLPRLSLEGTDFVGIVEVPLFETALPVGASWGEDAVAKYPCRYWGNPYEKSLILGGSDGAGQFDFMKNITEGDSVFFTDVTGLRFSYTVSQIFLTGDVSFEALSAAEGDLILFARNTYSLDYTVVCCKLF